MGMQRGFSRSQMTRTRYGVADITVDPAWVRVHPTGQRKIIVTSGAEVGITAEVRFVASADVAVYDFLYFAPLKLRLFVYQIIPEQATSRALCQEVPAVIPDEFDNAFIEPWWTQALAGGAISEGSIPDVIVFTPNVPGVQLTGNAAFIYQTISGDFDVYTRLGVTNSGLADGQSNRGFIGARLDTSHGVYIGNHSYRTGIQYFSDIVAIDQYGASAGQQDEWSQGNGVNFVRLQRRGVTFHAYYCTNGAANVPASESEWIEADRAGQIVTGGGPVQLGIGGYLSNATIDTSAFFYFRNWIPGAQATVIKGTLRTGVAMAGTKNGVNKVFTIPESFQAGSEIVFWNGQRQVRGDDYTISGVTLTFSAGHPAPASGDTLVADYVVGG